MIGIKSDDVVFEDILKHLVDGMKSRKSFNKACDCNVCKKAFFQGYVRASPAYLCVSLIAVM